MAIFGVGATHDENEDVSQKFIDKGVACIGWDRKTAQPLYALMEQVKISDVIYIKHYQPIKGLTIKAVGIAISDEIKDYKTLGNGVAVRWIWSGNEFLGAFKDKYNVRQNTFYEEYNYKIQSKVLELLFSRLKIKKGS